ncbi:dihydroxyacetone kinase subunit DhaK [Egibacter rhizosphaerae]|uniref:phosphoenolpyruvate--glycerone phosphotransferase n=1 Tax=Egibacter rhizosphaerae TaxID=1670831 RepID=A0A411YHS2_9ACTN|nr:dihydroxyacetone kinase subunit DhaK [Egibacter rhizosphaerae]QBI20671.1 dihydroxyacetone kinase subunit DhaK [Egibacter rhizosphaerae]
MKKLINDPQDVVTEALEGIQLAHGDRLTVHYDPNWLVRNDAPIPGKVGIVSGGGSGHEPLHGGFVGPGMLDAAVPGPVFTSPTPDQVQPATKAVDSGKGVLQLIKNYTGDVANFEMAGELAEAEGTTQVKGVVIDDDVAVQDSSFTAGRRGVGGTVLIEKLVGAAADEGRGLDQLATLASALNGDVRSMGMALTSCTVPHAGEPTFSLAEDEMEIGIGIHGEPGRERMKLESADAVVERLLNPILEDLPFGSGDDVLLFVNGMGGTPLIELYIVYRRAAQLLADRGITVVRNLVGDYITSLEMAGCSLTLLKLDDDRVRLWDAPVNTPGLRWGV